MIAKSSPISVFYATFVDTLSKCESPPNKYAIYISANLYFMHFSIL